MFSARDLMDPNYAALTSKGSRFTYQMNLKIKPTAMNWADPFRPDDTIPEHIKKATIDCINTTGAHYTFPVGDAELRKEVAKRVKKINGLDVDYNKNITISCGSDIAFAFVMRPFLTPGEENEVMMPIPSYAHNFTVPPLCGGKSVPVPTYKEDNYDLRISEFEKRLTPKTKMVIITNPNNPTTTVYRRDTLIKLADFVKENNLILVVDQCFEDTVFDGYEMTNIAALPDMFERTIIISSFSKGMGLCGYRVAYIVASDDITDMFHACTVTFLGAPNTAAQAGIIAGLKNPGFMEQYRQEYMVRADMISEILDTIPNISYNKPESCFYFWIDTSKYGTDIEVQTYLAENAALLVSNGGTFGDCNYIRLIYGALSSREECIAAIERMKQALLAHPINQ